MPRHESSPADELRFCYSLAEGLTQCPNSCSNNGDCEKGICKCFHGFQGNDCSQGEEKSRGNIATDFISSHSNLLNNSRHKTFAIFFAVKSHFDLCKGIKQLSYYL